MQIKNFSNYEIFPNEGKIFSYKTNRWIGAKDKDGYWLCTLTSDEGKIWTNLLHRIIWFACNGEIPQGMQVNHLDENKDNNSIDNLNLMTPKENCNWGTHNERVAKANSKALKGNTNKKGRFNNKSSKQVGAFKNGSLIMLFPSTAEAQRQGYNKGAVSMCCNNCFNRQGNNTYKGFQWQYV
jgi:hypothetical protein